MASSVGKVVAPSTLRHFRHKMKRRAVDVLPWTIGSRGEIDARSGPPHTKGGRAISCRHERSDSEQASTRRVEENCSTPRVIGVFATVDRGGTIHAVPMWFASDEQSILLATGSRSRKVENLKVDSCSTLVIHDSRPGFEVCGVSMVGDTDVVHGAEAGHLIRRVHRRYVNEEGDVPKAARAFLDSDDVALRFRPRSALTWDERGSLANKALRAAGRALPLLTTEPRR